MASTVSKDKSEDKVTLDLLSAALTHVICRVPHRVALAFGAGAGRLACALVPAKRRRIRDNLERAGAADPAGGAWRAGANIGRTVAEIYWLLRQPRSSIDPKLRVTGLEIVRDGLAAGRGVLLAGAHIGNWELGAQAAARAGAPVHAVARDLGSPRVEAAIARFREAGGVRTLVRGEGATSTAAYRALRNGHVLACMMDRVSGGRRIPVPFAGARAQIPLGPLVLARRAGSRIVVGGAHRAPDGATEVVFHALPHVAPEDETIEELAHRVGALLDSVVREHPEEWYWIYRRPAGDRSRRRSVAAPTDGAVLDVPGATADGVAA